MVRFTVLLIASTLGSVAEVTPGELLIAEMNCVACHSPSDAVKLRLASRSAPRLGPDGVKVTPQWLRAFLADPQKTKPGTLMPDMFQALPPDKKVEVVESLTHFLVKLQGERAATEPAANIDEGKERYHALGCVQCHAPFDAPAGRDEEMVGIAAGSVPLGVATKYSVAELSRFLMDPLKSRPGGRMPSLGLSQSEAESISAYLLREQLPDEAPFALDEAKAAVGAQYFVMFQCGNCHEGTPNPFTVSNLSPSARKFGELRPRQPTGCLSAKPKGNVPKFELTDRQKTVIIAALKSQEILSLPLTDEQQIRRTMTALNCYACHSRGRSGGIAGLRREYVSERDKLPPNLNGVGSRLTGDQLLDVLTNGRAPHSLKSLRMPVFGKENVSHLPALLEKADALKQ